MIGEFACDLISQEYIASHTMNIYIAIGTELSFEAVCVQFVNVDSIPIKQCTLVHKQLQANQVVSHSLLDVKVL